MDKFRDVDGRVCVITGAGRGIGKATALLLARHGAKLAVVDRDFAPAEEVAAEIIRLGRTARAYALDVTQMEQIEVVFARIERELGEIDVLVNNAGIMCLGRFLDQPTSRDAAQLHVNLDAVISCMRAVLPKMLERKRGHVINVASVAGKVGAPFAAVYSASKHAVIGLTEAVRAELDDSGVDFSYVMPSLVRTELIAGAGEPAWPPVASPEDVARAVLQAIRTKQVDLFVPRAVRLLMVLPAVLPRFALDWIGKKLKVDQMFANIDQEKRAEYQSRVDRAAEDSGESKGPFGPTPRASA